MPESKLPDKPYYRVGDLAKRWGCEEQDVVEYIRCGMLTISTYLKDDFADLTDLTDHKTAMVELDGIFPIDGMTAAMAYYSPNEGGGIDIKRFTFCDTLVEFSHFVRIDANHLLVEKKHLEEFEGKYEVVYGEKVEVEKPLTNKERDNLLRTIGLLVQVHLDTKVSGKLGSSNNPNISQIVSLLENYMEKKGIEPDGMKTRSLTSRVTEGLKIFKDY